MAPPKHTEVKRGIAVLWETLQCPICLDLLTKPVSTKCDHQFCKFCMLKLLDNAKQSRADCPVCKEKITKRSLQESPGFQRLVTGLQDMIQAYEHDTGTNYLTGLAQERRRAGLNDDKRVAGTPDDVEDVEKAPPSSHSSTIAALNGFAKVMGFGDSDPVTTEGEVQDGSVQTSQSTKLMEATANASRLATRGKRRKDQVVPVVSEIQPLTRISRQKQKKDEGPEQIFENRKKKSKQKVAEWLMRAPAEGSLESAQPAEVGQAFDDSDSSASTLDLQTLGKKEEVAKTLEEHVFGATYTRRGNHRASNKSRSHSSEKLSERRKMTTGTEDKPVDLEAPATVDISEEPGNCETPKTELDKSPENDEMTILGALHPERKPTKRLRSASQQVDSDLQAKAETESSAPKKADRRRGPSERGKSARAVQPLVLVGVQDGGGDAKNKLPSEAAQVHIENYPSSEDQEAAVATGTGRSRRLHLSSQNVRQAPPQKAATRQWARAPGGDVKDGGVSDLAAAKACKSNGCVYDKDICAIENMDISHLETLVQGVPPTQSEAGADREPPLIPPCAGLLGAAPPSMQSAQAEKEDCRDSEMDTSQILRSFKDTKRKSFRLARQSGKKSRSQDEELAHSSGKSCRTRLAVQRSKQQQQQTTTTPSSDLTDPSTCSDLLPPTNLPARKMAANLVAAPVLLGSSLSSALSPNKVTTRETESPLASMVPQVVDSGLRFRERQEIPESLFESAATGNCSASTSQHLVNADCSLTPDGLGVQPSQPPHGTQTSPRSSARSNPRRMTRMRTRRLRNSPESLSSSQDTPSALPPIFHDAAEAHQHKADDVAVRCESPDRITASQASVDLFDSPEESDVPVNDASVSAESSQFASEVLVTQQKVEMQKELVRLEKLMALVTEVLQEKEANSAVCSDAPKSDPRDPNASCDPDGEDPGRSAEELAKRLHDGEHSSQPAVETSPHAGPAGKSCGHSKDKENTTPERDGGRAKMTLVSSGLAHAEQMAVRRFARRVGARVVSQVTAEVTHIVMCTDEQLVCERTLKYFLGIAGRKWVVSFQWIAECFKQKKLVDESLFEVRGDVVNGSHHLGPKRARTTADHNLLMKGYEICFQGPFANMTTEEMEWMVQQCGATVAKDPLVLDGKRKSNQLVIVQPGTDPRLYSGLARQATLVSRGWLLDTVATYTLQGYGNYLI